MPDRRPLKSKFLTRLCEGGLRAASAWHDNQSQTRSPGATGRGDKWMLKSLASALQTRRQWAHASRSFFSIQQHLSSLSELITEPLVSGTKYHHATDGNWIPLIRLNNGQQIKRRWRWGEGGGKSVWVTRSPHTACRAQRWRGCLLQLQEPRGDSFNTQRFYLRSSQHAINDL